MVFQRVYFGNHTQSGVNRFVLLRSILVLAALPAFAQFQVSMVPESLGSSAPIFGKGRDVGRWFVLVCSDYTVQRNIDRTRILRQFPDIHVLPARETEDQLSRKAASDSRSVIGNVGDAVLAVAGGGTALGGLAAGSTTAQYVGWGITAVQVGLKLFRAAHPPPNAQPYITDMLPDQISLDAGKCLPDKWVVASLTHNAHTEQATIFLPGDPVAARPQPTLHPEPYNGPTTNTFPVAQPPPQSKPTAELACPPWIRSEICGLEMASATDMNADPIVNLSSALWGF